MKKISNRFSTSSIFIFATIAFASMCYYCLILFQSSPLNLHDGTHYAVSGVAMVRDHKNLIYPYSNLQTFSYGATYEAFQNGTAVFETRIAYPNQLFSLFFGSIFLITKQFKLWYLHIIGCVAFILGNYFSFLSARTFLSKYDSLLALVAINTNLLIISCLTAGTTDIVSYFCISICFFYSLKSNPNSLIAGLLIGISVLLRSQNILFVLFLPLFFPSTSNIKTYLKSFFKMLISVISTVYIFGKIVSLFVQGVGTGSSSIAFYITYFKEAIYRPSEITIVIYEFFRDTARIFDGHSLYIFCLGPILVLLSSRLKKTLEYKISLAVFAIIIPPIAIYALERFFPVVPRYYITAVPLLFYSLILFINNVNEEAVSIPKPFIKASIIIIAVSNLFSYMDVKRLKQFSLEKMYSVATFLDFSAGAITINERFGPNSIVISNHSLVTGISNIKNLVYVPPFDKFLAGDNSKVDGIIFTYTENPEAFTPKDWLLQDGSPKSELIDHKGNKFKLVHDQKNTTWTNYISRMLVYIRD